MTLPGYDAWLEKPYADAEAPEVQLQDVECEECCTVQDVTASLWGDEAEWECVACETTNTTFWDDDPEDERGWRK